MLTLLKARLGRSERGFALIIVIAIGAVLMILATVAVTASISGTMKARQDQASNAALSAAYAGVEEYQSRLSNDSYYVQYGNPSADFTGTSDVTLPTGSQENPAFGIGTRGTWATVAGSGGTTMYRYEVNTEDYLNTGVIRVRATGLVNGVTRSVIADLRQTGFIDFLYFTDYEIQDPEISGESSSCVKYEWAGRSSSCGRIQFAPNDVINGPLHSNDTLYICEANFNGAVTTSNSVTRSGGRLYDIPSGCGTAHFNSGALSYSNTVGMPSTNSQMKREVRSDLTTSGVPKPGCLYTGPTSVVLNSDGTMTVRSPWTKKTQITGDPATGGSTPAMCGSISSLRSAGGATITVPDRNLIYVQNVPTVSSDPNYWSRYESGQPSCAYNGNPIGYPISSESASSSAYGCKNGDVFVKGTMHGQMTIAAENYVYVTGDITYKNTSTDVLGLVGNNAVWVWNPMDRWGDKLLSGSNREIDAAMISVLHTFQVQNYRYTGNRGTLTIKGAIAQKFRGPVGTGYSDGTIATGYAKDYNYDPRFRYTAPPKFLSPVTTTYGVTTWMDTPAAMSADGSYR
jgi:type II secretory pathway pseudopilin PulG